jgi:hypothetical protein
MYTCVKGVRRETRGSNSQQNGSLRVILCCSFIMSLVGNCTSNQTGPTRPISIDNDVVLMRPLAEPDLTRFYNGPPTWQAATRNQMVTARMYIADMEYNYYEARLTREMQNEGLLATAVSLGLTGSAALIPVAQTDRLLAGIATGVTGLDKAYNEKELLSNTVQALQTQMRADRKTQAAAIYSKMFQGDGNNKAITPIDQYTLPMALSDSEKYYQAGTIASALIGLSKTVANAEQNADLAKDQAGPNPRQVTDSKTTAVPLLNSATTPAAVRTRSAFISDDAGVVLKGYLRPNGVRDSAHAKVISDFMKDKEINVPIFFFLDSPMYRAERIELVQRLKSRKLM